MDFAIFLIQIGNSQGIRIPKPIIEQAHLSGFELELKVVDEGLLIKSHKSVIVRDGWQESIENHIKLFSKEQVDNEWLHATLIDDSDIEW
ncbi:AbrB/MazE/SpoVT family DNA-binding domain-containing protein [Candidatus Ruthia endofausta]|uniref:AbrB/MazE/SpoVT family DNA-binding domain-containing protein n=1 Tax=Candidatus Ruthia endofausta TaxID=2738852 RepID=A0A6N0HQ91_9GAMM|nr:AbrB/MazE/SpoVT family DNA-binding domain-containing protein [Candidatus Ruthia endofausta]QKQ24486.1 AbrB/MazE/SpoVT family DNA-binding domain-containing protein [Candidatus Ruthia endofausta]